MSLINKDIISEIDNSDTDESIKIFLNWLIDFEKDHIDKENFSYKQEMLKKIKELNSIED